jgi:hypothetical protein
MRKSATFSFLISHSSVQRSRNMRCQEYKRNYEIDFYNPGNVYRVSVRL